MADVVVSSEARDLSRGRFTEPVLACAGYRIMDGDHDTLIIRNNETDTDYEIRVEEIAN